mgnify:CR=1 FL=1
MDLSRHDFQLEELIDRIKGHDHRREGGGARVGGGRLVQLGQVAAEEAQRRLEDARLVVVLQDEHLRPPVVVAALELHGLGRLRHLVLVHGRATHLPSQSSAILSLVRYFTYPPHFELLRQY